jgi:AMP nucleosidase
VPVEIGESSEPIPIHFAYRRDINIEASLSSNDDTVVMRLLRDVFDTPDLAAMDDDIADGTIKLAPGAPEPLALFRAARVDYSLRRLYHYTGTDPDHFQNFVIFTNYQFYVDAFAQMCRQRLASGEGGLEAFVEPGNVVTRNARLGGGTVGTRAAAHAAMPALHLVQPRDRGITLINIGTGPSNARNITDHVAVLRPACLADARHCAGLRQFAEGSATTCSRTGYVREDHVLDQELPLWAPSPALAEMQVALGAGGRRGHRASRLRAASAYAHRNRSRASTTAIGRSVIPPSSGRLVAVARRSRSTWSRPAIARTGFRFPRALRHPCCCVSDKPLHGEIKLAGMAGEFYRQRVGQHLEIGLRALEKLKRQESERLHSRKLRSFAEVAFQ